MQFEAGQTWNPSRKGQSARTITKIVVSDEDWNIGGEIFPAGTPHVYYLRHGGTGWDWNVPLPKFERWVEWANASLVPPGVMP